jgi:hypothetical protein
VLLSFDHAGFFNTASEVVAFLFIFAQKSDKQESSSVQANKCEEIFCIGGEVRQIFLFVYPFNHVSILVFCGVNVSTQTGLSFFWCAVFLVNCGENVSTQTGLSLFWCAVFLVFCGVIDVIDVHCETHIEMLFVNLMICLWPLHVFFPVCCLVKEPDSCHASLAFVLVWAFCCPGNADPCITIPL